LLLEKDSNNHPARHLRIRRARKRNAVEGFFAKLTKRRLKRGVFRSVTDLQAAINRFLAEYNGGSHARRPPPLFFSHVAGRNLNENRLVTGMDQ
jgi:hypothetical protein